MDIGKGLGRVGGGEGEGGERQGGAGRGGRRWVWRHAQWVGWSRAGPGSAGSVMGK